MKQVLSLQNMKSNKDIELHARSYLSINCKGFSSISTFIC
ncbi:class III lanthipeptide [Alkalihalophilus marmarensis]|uniref:Uncharacterized protein n=1 Tax=Alkalihalophilus marmarensis DSM 21297 TaxID=1188261 RepID=U6SKA8_9BACI|nr:hypothetical protein A33I_18190 [Alkalihalophilus marmarensis DSM 21297]ERN52024.1 hypothetical protein A33I_18195 [Alkalihalophilus marmarensis DSM 21297]ERN52025.1 hypothetical protein A33I_18200 [Alkalihalophilus marmarensis DSM 21297]